MVNSIYFCFLSTTTVTEYFKGLNWKVNPDWVYCEYNTLKDLEKESDLSNGQDENAFREREPDTPEEQLLHFLARAGRQGWKWMSVSHLPRKWPLKYV